MAKQYESAGENASEGGGEEAKLLAQAHERIKAADDATSEIRRLGLEDLKFRAGDQWLTELREQRKREGKPCLTFNKVLQSINQVTNDQRQNRPALKVHPIDSQADVETAKIIQGLFRHIEANSGADIAYDTAFEHAVITGFGYFRVLTEYADPLSFNQDILIKPIHNPFSVRLDPYSREPDGKDVKWASVDDFYSEDEYKRAFPKSKAATKDGWEALGNSAPEWMRDGDARVTEYFYIEYQEQELALLADGTVVPKAKVPEGVEVKDTRTSQVPQVKWCKLNGTEVLAKRDLPGRYIPIIPVYGHRLDIDGEVVLEGIIRHAKDPARLYNFTRTAQTEVIALAPKAPFIAEEGQIEGYEKIWETANTANHSVLPYKAKSVDGTPLPMPQRQTSEPPVMALTQAGALAADDIKATMGVYDASLGAKSNETSGVAIQRRNVQAQTSNFHFNDNLNRSQIHCGRIIVDWIPSIYDTERVVRIIGEEESQELVKINAPTERNGKPALYAMDTGKYDVSLDTGPSFATKRQEAATAMMEFAKGNPNAMPIIGDLIVKNMDWPGAQEMAERLKKMLPPQLQEQNKEEQQIPPQIQQQLQQADQMVQQLTAKLNEAMQEKEQKLIELESKERIAMAELETKASIELAKLKSTEAIEVLAYQIAELDQRTKQLGFTEPFETEGEPEQGEPEGSGEQMSPQEPAGPSEGMAGPGMMPSGGPMPGQPEAEEPIE